MDQKDQNKVRYISAEVEAEQSARNARYAPSRSVAVAGFLVAFVLDLILRRSPFLMGNALSVPSAAYLAGFLGTFVAFVLYLRLVRRTDWQSAMRYVAVLFTGLMLGSLAYALAYLGVHGV